jgi:hypothetical protein
MTDRKRGRLPVIAAVLVLCLARGACWLAAHTSLSLYIEHRCAVSVDPKNIDVTLDLVFYVPRARAELERIDFNRDGSLSASEIEAYLARVEREVDARLRLTAAGRDLPLFLLYEPRLAMEGRRVDARTPVTLRLSLFARTPPWLKPGDEVAVHDSLWLEEPGIHSFRAEGRGGLHVVAVPGNSPLHPGRAGGPARVSRLRCMAVPREVAVPRAPPGGAPASKE